MPNRFDASATRVDELVARRHRVLGSGYRLFYDDPVEVVRGEGVHLFDADGNEYLDAYNNVPCVGHCHPRVVEAIARQAQTLNTNTRYLDERILDYSERLLATHGGQVRNVMFTCTGSEATDLALRIARYATRREGVVVTSHAYHGVTTAAAEVSPSLGPHVPLGRSVRTVDPPRSGDDDLGARLASQVNRQIADLERHGIGFAAFLADSIFSSDGIWAAPPGFLKPVAEVVHRAGGLYISDEVQAGFGRTGEAMWGYQRHGLEPDLITMGKPMGNGIPIAGVAIRPELIDQFGRDVRYFNTFGGNSVSIAAAGAVLDVIEEDGLVENARAVGETLRRRLNQLAGARPHMRSVRGAGLYVGVDLVHPGTGAPDPELAGRVVNGLRHRRVLISATGPDAHTLKIRPPLPFADHDADRLLTELEDVLGE